MQVLQEMGGIIDVSARIEHLLDRMEFSAVKVMVDLHASDVDQLHPSLPSPVEGRERLNQASVERRAARDVHRISIQRPSLSGLGKRYGVENRYGNAILA